MWSVWAVGCTVASVISSITLLPAGAWLMRSDAVGGLRSDAVGGLRSDAFGGLRAGLFRRGLAWSILYAAAWIALVGGR